MDFRNTFSVNLLVNNFTKKNPVTTGQKLDCSSEQVSKNTSVPSQTSYQYKRVAALGIVYTLQLNLNDNTSSNMDFQTQLNCLNEMEDTATEPSMYINKSRIL